MAACSATRLMITDVCLDLGNTCRNESTSHYHGQQLGKVRISANGSVFRDTTDVAPEERWTNRRALCGRLAAEQESAVKSLEYLRSGNNGLTDGHMGRGESHKSGTRLQREGCSAGT